MVVLIITLASARISQRDKNMTLRKKTLLIIAGTFYGVIILLFFLSRNILLESFVRLEEQSTHQDVERVLSALSNEFAYLESTARDWAAWDDTYAFIEDANEEYLKSNLTEGTFTQMRLNIMMFIDSSGKTVFGRAFDYNNEEEIPISQSLKKHLSPDDLLLTHADTESSVTGVILLPESPMMVASCPILTSEDEGPIRGTLIIGRYLDATEIARLAEATHESLTVHQFISPQIPSDFQAVLASLSEETPTLVRPLNEQTIAGYTMITDIYGKPGIVLRVDMPRDIYAQGQASVTYLVLSIVGVSLIFGLATILLLERQVLSRLAYLIRKVRSIGTSGDLSSRVSMQGADELSDLGATINGMLAALQQSESELRESEERHRAIFEQAAESIVLIDAKTGALVEFNDRACENLGYNREEFEKLRLPDLEVVESAEEVAKHIEKIIKEGIDVFETKHRTKDGEIRDIQVSSRVISIRGREFVQSIWLDITERKRAQQQIIRAAQEWRTTFDSISDLISIQDKDFKITRVNMAFADAFKMKPRDVIGKTCYELVHGTDEPWPVCPHRKALKNGEPSREEFFEPHLGIHVEVTCSPIFGEEGEVIGSVHILHDITERKRAEEEIKKFKTISDRAGYGAAITDMEGEFIYVNQSLAQMHGYSLDELIGKHFSLLYTEDTVKHIYRLRDRLMQKGTYLAEELWRKRKDGTVFPSLTTAVIVKDDKGKPLYIAATAIDITERKQAEKKLQELYGKEKDLRQELEAEISKRVEFTRALVHELKTPITPVLASSELLLEELKEEHLLGLARNICQGAYNLNQRVDELLDLARGEVGMLRLNPESVDPRQLLQGIVDSVRPLALKNGQSLSSEVASSLPEVWADEDRLRQVVLNLINNAFKFTPAGGKITLKAKEDGVNLIVEVQDTGCGISEEEQPRLFEPYHQLEGDRARLSGLGLGLSLSKKLVELHGGRIWVKSQKGKGSTFSFSIPLEAASRREKSAGKGKKL